MSTFNRRNFLTALPALSLVRASSFSTGLSSNQHFKISLNAYSFNDMLMKKKISLTELLEFTAKTGFEAIDITGYYFSTYPAVPSNEEIFSFKRKAHELGLSISGTGVRNEFSFENKELLDKEIDLVKRWIEVAAKLGAPVLRVFTAKLYSEGDERKRVESRMIHAFQSCLETAKSHGIILGIQNHNDFLRTSDECHDLFKKINSPWLGLVLDTGNFIAEDPYEEIRKAIPLAVNWQVKEKLLIKGVQTPMNLEKLCNIIKSSAYKGFVPIETLGMQDPKKDIPVFFNAVSEALK
jgi:sugar phosphate isomerase/epimerase